MHDIDQDLHRQSTKLQNFQLNGLRHDHQNMSCINGIVFNPLQHYKIFIFLILDISFPRTIAIIRIMIADQHTVKTLADQFRNKILNRNLSIHRSFFCMTMHIKFHLFCSFFLLWLTSLVHAKYNRFPHIIQRFYEKMSVSF